MQSVKNLCNMTKIGKYRHFYGADTMICHRLRFKFELMLALFRCLVPQRVEQHIRYYQLMHQMLKQDFLFRIDHRNIVLIFLQNTFLLQGSVLSNAEI